MIDYLQFPRKNILCVDMKSFYGFCFDCNNGA